jgi:hypothetical protein
MNNIFKFILLLILAPNTVLIAQNQIKQPINNSAKNNSSATIYSSDFEATDGGWYQSSTAGSTWQWGVPNYNSTNSANSGTKCWDINLNTPYGSSDTSYLYTPSFNLSNYNYSFLNFYINFNTERDFDGMHLEYSTNSGLTWTILGTLGDSLAINWYNTPQIAATGQEGWSNSSGGWKTCTYDLTTLHSFANVQFRFVFASDNFIEKDGVSIDDFSITEYPDIDAQLKVINILKKEYKNNNTCDSIYFSVKNKGNLPLTNFNYTLSSNGATILQSNYLGSITYNQTIQIALPGFSIDSGINNIVIKISKTGDADTTNNSKELIIHGIYTFNLPYVNTFDNGGTNWYVFDTTNNPNSTWQLGIPNGPITQGTHSGNFAWDINLNGFFSTNTSSYLYTPLFNISSYIHPKLTFWKNYSFYQNYNGMNIEYRYENSNQWHLLDSGDSTDYKNWYYSSVFSLNNNGFAYNSFGWEHTYFNLDQLKTGPAIQLRFVFKNGNYPTSDGISIDDFSITSAGNFDAAIWVINKPIDQESVGEPCPINVTIKNMGTSSITNMPISYEFNNGTPITYNWTGTLLPDSFLILTIGSIIPMYGNNSVKIYTSLNQDDFAYNDTAYFDFNGFYEVDLGIEGYTSNEVNMPIGITTSLPCRIYNSGQINMYSFNIYSQLNNGIIDTIVWTGTLYPGSVTYETIPVNVPSLGSNTFKIFLDDHYDHNPANDTIFKTIIGTPIYNLPYLTDFETINNDWKETHVDTLTKWELGTPNFSTTNSTHSGSKCWDINLNTYYTSADSVFLFSPYFNLPSSGIAEISFWLNYNTYANVDGVSLLYSTNGTDWQYLGYMNYPNSTNWYNSHINLSMDGWSGLSSGWIHSKFPLQLSPSLSNVIFRYDFKSQLGFLQGGFSVDDFSISILTGIDEDNANNLISLYPNPAIDQVNLHLPNSLINKTLEIKNVLDQIISKKTITSTDDIIDIRNYQQGVYFISIENVSTISKKFIKQ